ncbi:DUF1847 domain-containing protein [Clostridium diolis]|uniref:DUF1847 domain-containing protein n=1 Tax=Clostridium diolis TaxID=223919 RepID=A0AAV3W7T5_9CLOT|nr:DUF1847 domain-containing protein [Clostridium diolis]QES73386.1 DUF1847 domain-containing protein [Clostridium diolis]GEA33713.1 hypothetical protein CDIOL_46360 [Clostridium diolis]
MTNNSKNSCSDCGVISCRNNDIEKYPKFCLTSNVDKNLLEDTVTIYKENHELGNIARVSASIESEFYGKLCRVEETIEFIKRMKYKKVGIATCVGLLNETKLFAKILKNENIEYYVVGCKVGAVDKTEIGIKNENKLNKGCGHESMCNPIMQAKILEVEKTDLNIVIGLCVGHDTLFIKHSKAPVTVMIVKDRVLGHNPVAALYTATSMYSRFK